MKYRESFFNPTNINLIIILIIIILFMIVPSVVSGYYSDSLVIQGNIIYFDNGGSEESGSEEDSSSAENDFIEEPVESLIEDPIIQLPILDPPSEDVPIIPDPELEIFLENSTGNNLKNDSYIFNIQEYISDGGFEMGSGSEDWQKADSTQIVSSYQGILPLGGSYMAQLGADGESLLDSFLKQDISSIDRIQAISFWYQIVSDEDINGFDEPVMLVYAEDEMIFKLDIMSFSNENRNRWQEVVVALPPDITNTFELSFYAGNTGDDKNKSIILIDKVTTNAVIINDQSRLFLKNKNELTSVINYEIDSDGEINSIDEVSEIEIDISEKHGLVNYPSYLISPRSIIKYWNDQVQDNGQDNKQEIVAFYDTTLLNRISDLAVYYEGDQEYTLSFFSPVYKDYLSLSEYEIRYSYDPISLDSDWNSLLTPKEKAIDVFLNKITNFIFSQRSPRYLNKNEVIVLTEIEDAAQIYFAVRQISASGRKSELSIVLLEKK